MKIAVLGAGAVGCYFGGLLARSGVSVTLIGRKPQMEAIARNGLEIDGVRIKDRIKIAATASLEEGVRGAGVVLFCVKTVNTETAARELQPFLAPTTTLLSLQNGVDNVDRIHAAIGRYAIPVAVYVAVEMTAPDRVTHAGRGDLIVGYRKRWPRETALDPLVQMFEQAEIPARVSDAIEVDLWTKMTMNCAYNAISALSGATYGRLVQFPAVRSLAERVIAETVAVAHAEGVPLSESAMVDAAYKLSEKMTAATSSTAQDIARGRPTEIDSLNGYVVRRGAELAIATPMSEVLVTLVKLREDTAITRRAG